MAVVTASNLVKHFDGKCAVDGIGLQVQEGEVRGLLGPNGAGKTTLLRMLLGLVRPDQGAVELFGRPVRQSDGTFLDGVSGFVEKPCFYPYLSARANLELLNELDGARDRTRIDELLDRVGLARRAADRVGGYSTGMRQLLGIAAALLRAPRLLLLDEPTGGLDPAGVREVGAIVRELALAGVAVVLSSHQIGEVEELCDSFTVLRSGRAVWQGTAAELRAQASGSKYALATSNDNQARAIARSEPGVEASLAPNGGLVLTAREEYLDSYVIALGRAEIAVRRLELLVSPLESMFFALAGEPRRALDPGRLEPSAVMG